MKKCNKCNTDKSFSEFHKDKQKKDGLYSSCKECKKALSSKVYLNNRPAIKERTKKYRQDNPHIGRAATKKWVAANKDKVKAYNDKRNESLKDGFYTVYELPGGHVGQTMGVYSRMSVHRSVGRITEGYIVLAQCATREEALDLEALYQSLSTNYKRVDDETRLRHIL